MIIKFLSLKRRSYIEKFIKASTPSLLIFVALGIFEILYFQIRGLGNDFTVFHKAGRAVLEGNNPWLVGGDKLYSAYLNGPIATLLVTCFGVPRYSHALLFARTVSVFLIPYIVRKFSKFFVSTSLLTKNQIYATSSILLFTFPVRSNLEYGQLFVIFLALFVTSISLLLTRENSWKSLFIAGVLLEICIEYKPQVFLFYGLVILFKFRRVIPSFFLTGLFSALISSLLTRDIPFRTWLTAIWDRSGGGVSTIDQMNIYALLSSGKIFMGLLIGAFAVFHFRQNETLKLSTEKNWKLIFTFLLLSTLLNFYLHPTDLLLPVIFLVLVQFSNPSSMRIYMAIGFAIVWSNNPLLVLISSALVFLIMDNFRNIKRSIWLLFPNIVFLLLVFVDHNLETRLRQTFNFIVVISVFQLVIFSHDCFKRQSPELNSGD